MSRNTSGTSRKPNLNKMLNEVSFSLLLAKNHLKSMRLRSEMRKSLMLKRNQS